MDDSIEAYLRKNGARGKKVLSILGKNRQFVNAMESPVGKEFLSRLVARIEKNREEFLSMDIDLSDKKFIEARAKLNESEGLLFDFLAVLDNQEALLREVKEAV